jgi:hypothetical protein
MLGLPDPPALNARAGVQRVDEAPPEQVHRDPRRGNEQLPRRRGSPGLARSRLAKQKPESWAGGTELSRRCHRQVELKRVRQQEYAVGGRAALKIGELYRGKFSGERGRPIIENLGDRDVADDAEREVHVGEAIAAAHSERPHHGPGYDAAVLLREPQHALAEGISLLDGEHAYFPRFFELVDLGTFSSSRGEILTACELIPPKRCPPWPVRIPLLARRGRRGGAVPRDSLEFILPFVMLPLGYGTCHFLGALGASALVTSASNATT